MSRISFLTWSKASTSSKNIRQASGSRSSSLASRGQAFDLADDVVGEEADGAGGEGRQAGDAGGLVAAERVAKQREDVAFDGVASCLSVMSIGLPRATMRL